VKGLVQESNSDEPELPSKIRVSVGSAIVMGLLEGKLDVAPTTAYLMTYSDGKCNANCGFCPQARLSQSKAELLSRVTWPSFPTKNVMDSLVTAVNSGKISRMCIQALNYPQVFLHLSVVVKAIKENIGVPVSVSCQPLRSENLWLLSKAGVDRVGIALDAATESIFDRVKGSGAGGPYRWKDEFLLLRVAVGIFGEGNVSTHLIVGLGETEREAVRLVQECVDLGVLPGLFAFTPVEGTMLSPNPQPRIEVYRRVQLARYLIVNERARVENMGFDSDGRIVDFGVSRQLLVNVVESGKPFMTSGCPGCNRPFYNEKPGGILYNYPRSLNSIEVRETKRVLKLG